MRAKRRTRLLQENRVLQAARSSYQRLTVGIMTVQDVERRRIARDLHDVTGQELALVNMILSRLARESTDSAVKSSLEETKAILKKVESDIRTLSYIMHPPLLDEMGLGSAVGWYIDGFTRKSGIKVDTSFGDIPRLSKEKEMALFRVVQEGLTNVLKHSGSHLAHVRLAADERSVRVTISDKGKGMTDESKKAYGVGIAGKRERLVSLGGNLKLSANEIGATVEGYVPIDEKDRLLNAPEVECLQAQPEQRTEKKRILIADDHSAMRQGVRMLLSQDPRLEICGEAVDGLDAVLKAQELNPDLIVMDLMMPKISGLVASKKIRNLKLDTKIVVYSSHDFPQCEQVVLAAGCDCFVSKQTATETLLSAICEQLKLGEAYVKN